jgi:hypothetical protein
MHKFLEIATRPEVGLVVSCWLIGSAVLTVLTGGSFLYAAALCVLAGMI